MTCSGAWLSLWISLWWCLCPTFVAATFFLSVSILSPFFFFPKKIQSVDNSHVISATIPNWSASWKPKFLMPEYLVAILDDARCTWTAMYFKNPTRHENEMKNVFMHILYRTQTYILHQMGKDLLRGWNFTRHEVNFITTKPDPEKNGGKNS